MNDRYEYRKSLVQPDGYRVQGHTLYTDADKDAPDRIKDSNGQVVLGQCRYCSRAEIELDEQCTAVHVDVAVGMMSESNGRITWYVSLYREGRRDLFAGFSVYSSASEGRARYHADEYKHFFGQGPKPDPTKYDTDLPGDE